MNSYWGGAVAATGAALVLGALPRIWEHQRPRDAVIFGLGAGILATSRPVEGLDFLRSARRGACCGGCCAGRIRAHARCAKRVLVPLAAILACVVGFVAYYNWRVAGSPLVFPHFIERGSTSARPFFCGSMTSRRSPTPIRNSTISITIFCPACIRPAGRRPKANWSGSLTDLLAIFSRARRLSIPFLALPWVLKDLANRLLLVQVALSVFGLWIVVYYHAHYAAPLMATLVVLMMQGMRAVRGWRFRGHAIGAGLTRLDRAFQFLDRARLFRRTWSCPNEFHCCHWLHQHIFSLRPLIVALAAVDRLRIAS